MLKKSIYSMKKYINKLAFKKNLYCQWVLTMLLIMMFQRKKVHFGTHTKI